MRLMYVTLLVIMLFVVMGIAGCVSMPTEPADTATIPMDKDVLTVEVLQVIKGDDVGDELAVSGFVTEYPDENKTAYLLQIKITCDELGSKQSIESGYVRVSGGSFELYIPGNSVNAHYVPTQRYPVPDKYDNKMLDSFVNLEPGQSITGWILFWNVPEGEAIFQTYQYGPYANKIPIQ